MKWDPGFISEKAHKALGELASCSLCPRDCNNNRLEDDRSGICRIGRKALISGHHPHFGEEAPLVGRSGSGTIFFSSCALRCIYCQNYDISHLRQGIEVSAQELASFMLTLEGLGCHNINLVSPSHFVPQILEALSIANNKGLNIPIVYNSSGYEIPETIELLDGVVDIYMPDLKFMDSDAAKRLAKAPDYPAVAKSAIKQMYAQVGDLKISNDGIASKGLLLRHLLLPDNMAGTEAALNYVAYKLSLNTYTNIMDQYYPCYGANDFPAINRRINAAEFNNAINIANKLGLKRLDKRNFFN